MMVDIHCHIFPDLDDGAESLDEAVQMAEMAIADGVTHVVGTPHSNGEYPFNPELIAQRREELQKKIGDRLILGTGCDFNLNYENLQDIRTQKTKYSINQKNYLLVEFNEFAIPPNIDDMLHGLQLLGLSPIITHPERNRLLRSHPEQMRGWLRRGCYVQVTAQSLTGGFGDSARKHSEKLLDEEMVHFVASDAHNLKRRPLRLREAYQTVAARRGDDIAAALFRDNPLAAFEGRSLPYEPEPASGAAHDQHSRRHRKRFIFF